MSGLLLISYIRPNKHTNLTLSLQNNHAKNQKPKIKNQLLT